MTLLLFDIDGTLVYSDKRDSRHFAATYQEIYGFPFPTIDWEKYPHVTDTTIFNTVIEQHFQRPVLPGEIDFFQRRFVEVIKHDRQLNATAFREVPAARLTLEQLAQDERYVVGIATGGWLAPAYVKLQHVGIDCSTLLISAADGNLTREAILQEVVQRAVQRYTAFQRIVYVGDAIWDIHTTRNLGINFVGIRYRGDVEVLEQVGASHVLQDYQSYDAFLEAVEQATPPPFK